MQGHTKYASELPAVRRLEEYGISQSEYEDYVGHYKNIKEEIKPDPEGTDGDGINPVELDYELMAYSNTKIDYP